MWVGRALGLGLQERFEGHRDARAGEGQETVGLWESLVCPLGESGIAKVLAPEKGPHLLIGTHLVLVVLADGVMDHHPQENLLEAPAQAQATHSKKPD